MHRKETILILVLTLVFSALACNMPYLASESAGTPVPTDSGFQAPSQATEPQGSLGTGEPGVTEQAAPLEPENPEVPPSAETAAVKRITIAATEELSRSGLLDVLINSFRQNSGYEVKVELGGSGRAFRLGRKYVADILLVNNPGNINEFISQGYGKERFRILHTDYVILGPENDPAGIKNAASAADAFKKIAAAEAKFVTRGVESDLVSMENRIWKLAGITPSGDWYVSATNDQTDSGGPGVLKLAYDFKAYTLLDRTTYLENREKFPLVILFEGDKELFNIYYAVPLNPEGSDKINYPAAQAFVQFLASPSIQDMIAKFGADRYGQPLYFADGGQAEP